MSRTATANLQPARVSSLPSEQKVASAPKASGPAMQSGAKTPDVFSCAARANISDATRRSRAGQEITAAERYAKMAETRQFLQRLAAHDELKQWLAVNNRTFEIAPYLFLTGRGLVREWEKDRIVDIVSGEVTRRKVTFGVPIPFYSVRLSEYQLTHVDLARVEERLKGLLAGNVPA